MRPHTNGMAYKTWHGMIWHAATHDWHGIQNMAWHDMIWHAATHDWHGIHNMITWHGMIWRMACCGLAIPKQHIRQLDRLHMLTCACLNQPGVRRQEHTHARTHTHTQTHTHVHEQVHLGEVQQNVYVCVHRSLGCAPEKHGQ